MNTEIFKLLRNIFPAALLLLHACTNSYSEGRQTNIGYDLSRPTKTLILPDTLREVSGLTEINATQVACVQDENGILFIYDINKKAIVKQQHFHMDGDYEGIARVNNTMYILRSDGTLFRIDDYTQNDSRVDSLITGISANNNEGLCYDAAENRLLIACKSKIGKGAVYKDKRVIYAFDLNTEQLRREPVFTFDLEDVRKFATKKKLSLPTISKKRGQVVIPKIKFRTSAIGIHPITGDLYLLSASDHLFFIFSRDGKLQHIEQLDPRLFNKAEGISFFANGDMLITNEAQEGKPTLHFFAYRTN